MDRKRICIIGNSHVAAWRLGLASVPQWGENCETDFFAARSDLMRDLELRESSLVPTTERARRSMRQVSGDKTQIDTREYTHFVLVGLGLNTVKPMEVLRDFRLHAFEAEDPEGPFVSKACFATVARSLVRGSTAMHLAQLLRKVSDAQIVVVPQPFPSEGIVRQRHWRHASRNGSLGHVVDVFRTDTQQAVKDTRCDLLWQPPATVARGVFTAQRYSTGSVRLGPGGVQHPPLEVLHMNAEYGAIMLRECLGLLH